MANCKKTNTGGLAATFKEICNVCEHVLIRLTGMFDVSNKIKRYKCLQMLEKQMSVLNHSVTE